MFTPEQQVAFHTRGYASLPGVLGAEDLTNMRRAIWRLLSRQGVDAETPATWPENVSGLQGVRRHDPDPRDFPALSTALDSLFGIERWRTRKDWGQALVTFPNAARWSVPHRVWHLDHPYPAGGGLTGANVFLLVDDVEPGGGGTAVVEGSPAVVERFVHDLRAPPGTKHKVFNRQLMASDSWLRALKDPSISPEQRWERFMARTHEVHGAPARIAELTGRAGDVIVCHPWLIHAPAPNASDRVRLMRVIRVRPLPVQPDG